VVVYLKSINRLFFLCYYLVSVVLKSPCVRLSRVQFKPLALAQDLSDVDGRAAGNRQSNNNSDTVENEVVCVDSPQVTPRVCKTPAVVQVQTVGMKRLSPKQTRVMGSIDRKKRFLTGSPTTSSDDSSCSFLSLKKMRRTGPLFASPEIPLATTARNSLPQKLEVSEQINYKLSRGGSSTRDSVGVARNDLPAAQKHVQIEIPSTTDSNSNMSESFLPQMKPKRGVVRQIVRKSTRKRAMVKFVDDYVSDSDSESPLRKQSPLLGLAKTSRRIC